MDKRKLSYRSPPCPQAFSSMHASKKRVLSTKLIDRINQKLSEKPHERTNLLTIKRVIATYMNDE